ncbi:adhesin biosynthesis transcription regulatory family protein [Escherichia coli]|uniref:adhesin biosynthesis transcription regulatory family protein n=1 Tax=Escherichia coli TaxID=562 RepID=UPI0021D13BDC|nr:adhesin biosynthesis transcription regulatory family protein [Escherichia coli]MCU6343476.1 adhesin biosynthesis transcription regulatory family protein [Escherichia coli]
MQEDKAKLVSALSRNDLANRSRQGWLIPGYVSEEQFWLLVGASSMHSEKVINALFEYLVQGKTRKEACNKYKTNSGHFSIGLNRLQHFSHTGAKLAKYYSEHQLYTDSVYEFRRK